MLLKTWILIQLLQLSLCAKKTRTKHLSAAELEAFLEGEYERNTSALCNEGNIAAWDYATDLSNAKKERLSMDASLKTAKVQDYYHRTYFKGLSPKDFKTEKMRRLMKSVTLLGDAGLSAAKYEKLTNVINEMGEIYSTAKVCPFKKQKCNLKKEGLSQDPDIEEIVGKSRDLQELTYLWKTWRDVTGKKMTGLYKDYVRLKNEAAGIDGFKNAAESWKDEYETPNLEKVVDQLWSELEPFYLDLHFYVRTKLKDYYGSKLDISDGLLPAHVTGNLHAQSWISLMPIVSPYPNIPSLDITSKLKAKNYTVLQMFDTANEFYKSMGMPDSSVAYNKKAMIDKPKREVVCHASAWEFCDKKDFRISMCTKVNQDDFVTIHHELGHIQYYLLYKHQLFDFRNAPNPGFHEAIGDAIVLSVINPVHLHKIGLLDKLPESKEADINSLMEMALSLITFLPFGLILDKWRWDVFSGKYKPHEWNDRWWYYRTKIQKLKPPIKRAKDDFDPGSKYHVPSDTQYLAYFIAHIIEFQLYRGLCIAAGKYKTGGPVPLHKCDFYESKVAGKKLMSGLKLGNSVHWSVALKEMTGESSLTTSAILEYFQPLIDYLRKFNANRKKRSR